MAILAAAALQLFLSQQFTLIHPQWLLPALEVALLASLTVINPLHMDRHTPLGRNLGLLLVAIISVDNGISAVLLDTKLIGGTAHGVTALWPRRPGVTGVVVTGGRCVGRRGAGSAVLRQCRRWGQSTTPIMKWCRLSLVAGSAVTSGGCA